MLAFACLLFASELPGSTPKQFPAFAQDGTLPLRVSCPYKFLHWEVFEVALYLPDNIATTVDALDSSTTKSLVIRYNWFVDKADVVDGFAKASASLAGLDDARKQAALKELSATFFDARDGDSYEMHFTPPNKVEFLRNGRPAGTSANADVAACFLHAWIADKPIDGAIRRKFVAAIREGGDEARRNRPE